ncbi:MAG: VWA domain-containing protein [Acidobacteria bacterium]|nr:VWA domain-containing protein [Acidobacteriota bacterium]
MRRIGTLLVLAAAAACFAAADAGVLIPSSVKATPDPAILSVEEFDVRIRVDHHLAKVNLVQVYANHTDKILEGTYLFSFHPDASVSDFAIWDGMTRIPGIILEKRRAAEIYQDLASQAIDPGLVQSGGSDEPSDIGSTGFRVKVAPIPPWGFKRVELEYQQALRTAGGSISLVLPLQSRVWGALTVRKLTVTVRIEEDGPLNDLRVGSAAYPFQVTTEGGATVGRFTGENVKLSEDLKIAWTVETGQPRSTFLACRGEEGPEPPSIERPLNLPPDRDGYFFLEHLLPKTAGKRAPVSLVLVVDTSLSMWWGKLGAVDACLSTVTEALTPEDRFNLVLANDKATPVFPSPVPATPENVKKALDAFGAAFLSGGTDPVPALRDGLKQLDNAPHKDRYLVLLGDWVPTVGNLTNARVLQAVDPLLAGRSVRICSLLVGDDANRALAQQLALRTSGEVFFFGERIDIDEEIKLFASHLGNSPYTGLALDADPAFFNRVYPVKAPAVFAEASTTWVGRYAKPGKTALRVKGRRPSGEAYAETAAVTLPEEDRAHPMVPRLWARARIDYLLDLIAEKGEDRDLINEIIALAKKYKFVTPYTSFLAAPRALLRPRVIQPMDPVVRIKADPNVVSASVVLPWGESIRMRYLPREGIWQARFFVPPNALDGDHRCYVMLRDQDGLLYREEKSFTIDSRAPSATWVNPVRTCRAGGSFALLVDAPQDTRYLTASLEGLTRSRLAWDPRVKLNTGRLTVPAGAPPGECRLSVIAEDRAHNLFRRDYTVRILP